MTEQISVFLENSSGQLADITGVLSRNGVDIRALNIAEASDYGVLRLITENPQRTIDILKENGFIVSSNEVAVVAVDDHPGALHEVLQVLADENKAVEYMYSIVSQKSGRAYMILRVSDPSVTETLLEEHGIHTADSSELEISAAEQA